MGREFTDPIYTLGVASAMKARETMIDVNGPITAFYDNCMQQGAAFRIDDAGKLQVTLPDELKANTFFQNEIVKRVSWLKELVELHGLMNRPLGPIDADRLRALAAKYGVELEWGRAELNGQDAGIFVWPDDQEGDADPDWQDPTVQESIDRSYPSPVTA
jgi:hypothetical protein